jgi:GH15 family glucan-1,4-alpha-glucosidase
MMAIVGFLPADDPRMIATIEAVAAHLTDDRGLVYRYRTEGGVDGLVSAATPDDDQRAVARR